MGLGLGLNLAIKSSKPRFSLESLGDKLLADFDPEYGITTQENGDIILDSIGYNPAMLEVAPDNPDDKRVTTLPSGFTLTNGSLLLDGTDDYAVTGNNLPISGNTPSFTLSFWAKLNANAAPQTLISFGAWSFINAFVLRTYYTFLDPDFGHAWQVATNGQDLNTTTAADTNWHHHCIRYDDDANEIEYFLDGVSQGTTGSTPDFTASPLYIGQRTGDGVEFSSMNITDIRLFGSAISDENISVLANKQDYSTGLILHLKCNLPSGELENGSLINSWTSTDDAITVEQADTDLQPHYLSSFSGLNSKAAVRFNGLELLKIASQQFSGTEGSIFAVYYLTEIGANYQAIFSQSDEAGANNFFTLNGVGDTTDSSYHISWKNGGTEDLVHGSSEATINNAILLEISSDGSTYTATYNGITQVIEVDSGSNQGNWFGDATGCDNFCIGGKVDSGGNSEFLYGYIGRILITSELDSATKQNVRSYLASEYGISLASSQINAYTSRFSGYGETLTPEGRTAVSELFDTAINNSIILQRGWIAGNKVNLTQSQGRMLELTSAQADFVWFDQADSELTVTGGALALVGDTVNKGYLTCGEPVFTNTNWTMLVFINVATRDSSYPPGTEAHEVLSQFLSGSSPGDMAIYSDQQCGISFIVFGASPDTISIHNEGMGNMRPVVAWITYNASTRVIIIYDPFTGAQLSTTTLAAGGFSARDLRFGIPEAGGTPRVSQFIGLFKFKNVLSEGQRNTLFSTYYDVCTRFNNQVLLYGNSVTAHSDATLSSDSWSGQFKLWGITNNCIVWMPTGMGARSYFDYRHTEYALSAERYAVLGDFRDPLVAAQLDNYEDKRIHILVLDDNQNIHGGTGIQTNPTAVEYQDLQHIVGDFITRLSAIDSDLKVVSGTSMAVRAVDVSPPHDPLSYATIAAGYWWNNLRDWAEEIRNDLAFDAVYDLYADFNQGWDVGDDGNAPDPTNDLPNGNPSYFLDDAQHPNDDGHDVMYTGYVAAVTAVKRN